MRPTFLIKTLLPVLGYLAANQAIANPFEGVEPNKYCLKQVCLGAPLSSLPDVLKALTAANKLPANPCDYHGASYEGPFDSTGTKFRVSVMNDPSLQGGPIGEYYRISRVQVVFDKPLSIDDRNALDQELKTRMGLNKEGHRDIVSSYKGLRPRLIDLSRWEDSFAVEIDIRTRDPEEVRAYQSAPGCNAKKPDL